jgi:hypothetical protein
MAINFPDSPSVNQQYSAAGKTWVYTGTSWAIVGLAPAGPAGGDLAGNYPNPDLALDALDGKSFTGTVVLPSTTSIGPVSSTEIGHLDGVTSAVQSQLNGKAATVHTHGIGDLTAFEVTSPSSGQLLQYNGTKWANTTIETDANSQVFMLMGA